MQKESFSCLLVNMILTMNTRVTCTYCSMQYVGHSTLKLSERFRDFFSKIKGGNNWTMDKHFENETNLCQKEDIRIQIIDHVRISEIDRLEAKEVMWATELQTFKPKGNVIDNASLNLNEKIKYINLKAESKIHAIYLRSGHTLSRGG